jgi:hypothetical protein
MLIAWCEWFSACGGHFFVSFNLFFGKNL